MSKAEKFLFIHIPKTGGSTFRHHMRKVYGNHEVYFVYQEEDQEEHLHKAMSSHAKAISGHVNWFVIRESGTLEESPYTFTLIREPQDQIISHFMHRRRGHKWTDRNRLKDDFRDFLGTAWSRNWQSAFLSGLDRDHYLDPNVDELKAMAMENLKKIDMCASTDQIREAVGYFRYKFNWKRSSIEDRNVSKKSHLLDVLHEEFDKQLKEINRADYSLYKYSKAKMEKAWNEVPFWKKF